MIRYEHIAYISEYSKVTYDSPVCVFFNIKKQFANTLQPLIK